ncbi:MAG TPA: glycosyltransferase family 2 protein [Kineosporiaceae bacterium]|nr:glycosyltransferase family 2 protein [Kineosporiaceae bacterium]
MIVRDEQDRLATCLDSAAPVADEIVVVDTGSTDATVEIARRYGAIVLQYGFDPADYARVRNLGLDAARGRYVLVMDADEVLTRRSLGAVRECLAGGEDGGWIVTRRNLPAGSRAPAWVDHAVRLFRNRPQYRFRHRVHETVDDAILASGGRLQHCSVVLDHHLAEEDRLRQKWQHYVELLREELAAGEADPSRLVFLMADYYKLGMLAQAAVVADRIAETCPEDFTARFQAALCHLAQGEDLAAARSHLAAALALRPHDREALELAAALDGPVPVSAVPPPRREARSAVTPDQL